MACLEGKDDIMMCDQRIFFVSRRLSFVVFFQPKSSRPFKSRKRLSPAIFTTTKNHDYHDHDDPDQDTPTTPLRICRNNLSNVLSHFNKPFISRWLYKLSLPSIIIQNSKSLEDVVHINNVVVVVPPTKTNPHRMSDNPTARWYPPPYHWIWHVQGRICSSFGILCYCTYRFQCREQQ